jgi:hypothetical protein
MTIESAKIGKVVVAFNEREIRELMDAWCVALRIPFVGRKSNSPAKGTKTAKK